MDIHLMQFIRPETLSYIPRAQQRDTHTNTIVGNMEINILLFQTRHQQHNLSRPAHLSAWVDAARVERERARRQSPRRRWALSPELLLNSRVCCWVRGACAHVQQRFILALGIAGLHVRPAESGPGSNGGGDGGGVINTANWSRSPLPPPPSPPPRARPEVVSWPWQWLDVSRCAVKMRRG